MGIWWCYPLKYVIFILTLPKFYAVYSKRQKSCTLIVIWIILSYLTSPIFNSSSKSTGYFICRWGSIYYTTYCQFLGDVWFLESKQLLARLCICHKPYAFLHPSLVLLLAVYVHVHCTYQRSTHRRTYNHWPRIRIPQCLCTLLPCTLQLFQVVN